MFGYFLSFVRNEDFGLFGFVELEFVFLKVWLVLSKWREGSWFGDIGLG